MGKTGCGARVSLHISVYAVCSCVGTETCFDMSLSEAAQVRALESEGAAFSRLCGSGTSTIFDFRSFLTCDMEVRPGSMHRLLEE